jgi:hypothetical protein
VCAAATSMAWLPHHSQGLVLSSTIDLPSAAGSGQIRTPRIRSGYLSGPPRVNGANQELRLGHTCFPRRRRRREKRCDRATGQKVSLAHHQTRQTTDGPFPSPWTKSRGHYPVAFATLIGTSAKGALPEANVVETRTLALLICPSTSACIIDS